jgi:hypothetical protein
MAKGCGGIIYVKTRGIEFLCIIIPINEQDIGIEIFIKKL